MTTRQISNTNSDELSHYLQFVQPTIYGTLVYTQATYKPSLYMGHRNCNASAVK